MADIAPESLARAPGAWQVWVVRSGFHDERVVPRRHHAQHLRIPLVNTCVLRAQPQHVLGLEGQLVFLR
eukprot:9111305-Alexandrium_andersonii.AAC.1